MAEVTSAQSFGFTLNVDVKNLQQLQQAAAAIAQIAKHAKAAQSAMRVVMGGGGRQGKDQATLERERTWKQWMADYKNRTRIAAAARKQETTILANHAKAVGRIRADQNKAQIKAAKDADRATKQAQAAQRAAQRDIERKATNRSILTYIMNPRVGAWNAAGRALSQYAGMLGKVGRVIATVAGPELAILANVLNFVGRAFMFVFKVVSTLVTTAFKALAFVVNVLVSALQFLGGVLGKVLMGIVKLGATIVSVGVAGMTAATYAAVKATSAYAEYEQQLRNSMTVMGEFGDKLKEQEKGFDKLARTLGLLVGKNALQVAEAFYQIGSAGFTGPETAKIAGPALILARATNPLGKDMAQEVELLTSTMKAFAMPAEKAGEVVDLFSAAIARSPLNIERMAAAMPYVTAMASGLGLTVEDVATNLAMLSQAGILGTMGGTAARGWLTRAETQPGSVKAALRRNRMSGEQIEPGAVGVEQSIQALSGWGSYAGPVGSRAQRTARTKDIMSAFGMRAGPGMVALVNKGVDAYRAMKKEITQSGYAMKMVSAQMDTQKAQWEVLQSLWYNTKMAFGEAARGGIMVFLKAMQDALTQMNNSGMLQNMGNLFGQIAQGASVIVAELAKMGPQVTTTISNVVVQAIAWIAELIPKLPGYVADAMKWLAETRDKVFKGVQEGLKWVSEAWEKLTGKMAEGMKWLGGAIQTVTGWGVSFGEFMQNDLPGILSTAGEAVLLLASGFAALALHIKVAFDWGERWLGLVMLMQNPAKSAVDAATGRKNKGWELLTQPLPEFSGELKALGAVGRAVDKGVAWGQEQAPIAGAALQAKSAIAQEEAKYDMGKLRKVYPGAHAQYVPDQGLAQLVDAQGRVIMLDDAGWAQYERQWGGQTQQKLNQPVQRGLKGASGAAGYMDKALGGTGAIGGMMAPSLGSSLGQLAKGLVTPAEGFMTAAEAEAFAAAGRTTLAAGGSLAAIAAASAVGGFYAGSGKTGREYLWGDTQPELARAYAEWSDTLDKMHQQRAFQARHGGMTRSQWTARGASSMPTPMLPSGITFGKPVYKYQPKERNAGRQTMNEVYALANVGKGFTQTQIAPPGSTRVGYGAEGQQKLLEWEAARWQSMMIPNPSMAAATGEGDITNWEIPRTMPRRLQGPPMAFGQGMDNGGYGISIQLFVNDLNVVGQTAQQAVNQAMGQQQQGNRMAMVRGM